MHPYVIRELAQIREQELMQEALMARAARQARRQHRRASLREWLSGRFAVVGTRQRRRQTEPSPTLPPILRPEIRREAR